MIFFFQAEDGIRDLYVTGVQTCALPIYTISDFDWISAFMPRTLPLVMLYFTERSVPSTFMRSEERRVGKEWSGGGWENDQRKKGSDQARDQGRHQSQPLHPPEPRGRVAGDDFFFSSRRRHTRSLRDWSSDVCSSDLHNK